MSNSAVGGVTEPPISMADVLNLQNEAGAGNFTVAYTTALGMPLQTTAYELSGIHADIDQYGELQSDFEDLSNALRSHANDQVFTATDKYRKVLDMVWTQHDTKTKEAQAREEGTESTAEQDKWAKSRGEIEAVRNSINNGEKLSGSKAAGASALIAEAKGWVIPASKTRDVTSSKVKFLDEEYKTNMEKMSNSIRSQFSPKG
jgi:hypothetical protein